MATMGHVSAQAPSLVVVVLAHGGALRTASLSLAISRTKLARYCRQFSISSCPQCHFRRQAPKFISGIPGARSTSVLLPATSSSREGLTCWGFEGMPTTQLLYHSFETASVSKHRGNQSNKELGDSDKLFSVLSFSRRPLPFLNQPCLPGSARTTFPPLPNQLHFQDSTNHRTAEHSTYSSPPSSTLQFHLPYTTATAIPHSLRQGDSHPFTITHILLRQPRNNAAPWPLPSNPMLPPSPPWNPLSTPPQAPLHISGEPSPHNPKSFLHPLLLHRLTDTIF